MISSQCNYQTEIIVHNNESILIEKWLDTPYLGMLFTNQEIMDDRSLDITGDWYNPFTEPEKLAQERQEMDMKPHHWRQYVVDNYPGIDSTEQFRLRKEEVGNKYRLERVAKCRLIVTRINPETSDPMLERLPPCKQYDLCPDCTQYKIETERKKLQEFIGKTRVVIVSKEDEKKTARQIKDNYRRYPMDDGQTAFVIETDDKEIGEELDHETCLKLSRYVISATGRRVSGKLGESKKKEEEPEDENKIMVKHRRMAIEYNSKDKNAPQNVWDLHKIVLEETEITTQPKSKDQLQWMLYELEEKYRTICERYEMSFSFVDTQQYTLALEDIDWKWTKDKHPPG